MYGSWAAAAVRYPDLIGRYYNRLSGEHGDALSALNTVFAQDGAFVYVPRGVRVARPLLVTFAHYSEDEALRCFARSLFVFERDSEVQLVIDDRSEGDGAALDCDFYAFSGHKLYGPTGIGVLYGKERWLERMPPFMGGGDMVATVSFAGTTYAELPLKFEAGTANYIGAIGLGEAIRYVEGVDREAAARYESGLTAYATEKLSAVEGLRIYGSQLDKCSILSFTIDGTHPYDVGMILDKLGIAVRTGTHCAEPVMAHYGITSMVRASLAMYNTFGEIDMLAEGLKRAARMLRS